MRRPVIYIILALTFASPTESVSQDKADETLKNIQANMSDEAIQCASFFSLAADGFKNAQKIDESKQFNNFAVRAFDLAAALTKQAGMKPETVDARAKLIHRDHLKRIDNNLANISLLMVDYMELCVVVLNAPEERLKHFILQELGSELINLSGSTIRY